MAAPRGWTAGYSDGWPAGYVAGQADVIAWMLGDVVRGDALDSLLEGAAALWCFAHNVAVACAIHFAEWRGEFASARSDA